jgi:TonB-dependent receptor
MNQNTKFVRKVLPSIIAACVAGAASQIAFAQQNPDSVDEIVITGVKAAQERAIDIKKNSAEVVDSISAEDIGKLPDATLSDSLQRVTGIQIQRSAGQGGIVSIRGSNEVLTTLNGELFLTANNIADSKADYTDVPSSLISGANVSKSSNAKQLEGGIGGSVDLLTKRSLTLPDGLSASVRLQASNGSITQKTDPEISGLLGFNSEDSYAMSLGFAIADQSLSSHKTETRAANQNRGDALMMMSWDGPVSTNFDTQRDRLGLTYNFNAKLSDSLELNVDSFYNTIDEKNVGNQFYMDLDAVGWDYGKMKPEGVKSAGDIPVAQKAYATGWTATMNSALRAGVSSAFRETSAQNNSVELKFDNGGAFTGSLRYIRSKADRDSNQLTLVQRSSSPGPAGLFDDVGYVYDLQGNKRQTNPGYIAGSNFKTTFQSYTDGVSWTFDPAYAAAMAKPSAWYLHSSWIDGDSQTATLDAVRADGKYEFGDEGVTSIDFGFRSGLRSIEKESYLYFMPTGVTAYDPKDMKPYQMMVRYHEAGYMFGTGGRPGVGTSGTYLLKMPDSSYKTLQQVGLESVRGVNLDEANLQKYMHNVSDFGDTVKSFNATIPMLDPSKISDNVSFLDTVYGTKHVKKDKPDGSYAVEEERQSAYFSVNFDKPLAEGITLTGNAGVRQISQTLTVKQNVYSDSRLGRDVWAGMDKNHTYYVDDGDKFTTVTHHYFLPNINANIAFGEEYKLKLSYDERTSLQALDQFGNGPSTSWGSGATDPVTGGRYQPIGEVNSGGSPFLNPWEASVYNIAGEWYPTESSLLGATLFYMDIGGYTTSTRTTDFEMADSDGVVRKGGVRVDTINDKNASIKGVELSYQQSFDFLPGFLTNTGITFNYTYSPSTKEGYKFATDGSTVPFNATAKNQSNLVLWYNDDRFEFRVAANYLDKVYGGTESGAVQGDAAKKLVGGLPVWTEPTLFIDLSSTYHINDSIDLTLNVANLTEEGSYKYLQWQDFRKQYDAFERRINLGINAKF